MTPRAAVVGGGISGTTVSVGLVNRGYEVVLIERQPTWSVLGSGISLIFPAVRALDRVGVLDECISEGQVVDKVQVCDVETNVVEEFMVAPEGGTGIPGLLGIMRPKIHEILSAAALEKGLQVKLGTTVTAISQDDVDAVEVETSDGAVEQFDLLVAADGLHSSTRDLLFGEQPPPTFRNQAIFRALVPRPTDIDAAFQFRSRGNVQSGMTPIGPNRGYMFCLIPKEDRDDRPATEDLADLMRHHLSSFTGLAGELRDTIVDPNGIDYRILETFMLPKPWNKGRAVVLGDAAHSTTPHLGAGGAMCLEDAIALGEELDRAEDIPQALESFTERRFERCRYVVETSAKISEIEISRKSGDDLMYDKLSGRSELFGHAVALLQQGY